MIGTTHRKLLLACVDAKNVIMAKKLIGVAEYEAKEAAYKMMKATEKETFISDMKGKV